MKKVIIRTREDELTNEMWHFGYSCANSFIRDLKKETCGEGWKDCVYSNDYFKCLAQLNKNDTISICVFSKHS